MDFGLFKTVSATHDHGGGVKGDWLSHLFSVKVLNCEEDSVPFYIFTILLFCGINRLVRMEILVIRRIESAVVSAFLFACIMSCGSAF